MNRSTPDRTSPHFTTAALLLVDVQRDFIDGSRPVAGTAEALTSMAHLAQAFRRASRPIVHVVRLYVPGSSDVDRVRRADIERGELVVAPGSSGADIPTSLLPENAVALDSAQLLREGSQSIGNQEMIMFKPRWSAFYRTGLQEWLEERNVDTLVVAGCNLPNCPRATLFDATERDF